MEYNFRETEKKWQKNWMESGVYKVSNTSGKPKFYVLDMFPYPSGTGLHVGHPLGYIASDIYARYKRLKGFNVLHPMGYDSFGLPAEQYALETGRHPAITTGKNIETFRQQLDNIGLCFDWSREIRTSDPTYYKWTQWIFLQIFNSWYDKKLNKARRIEDLVEIFEQTGNIAYNGQRQTQKSFSASEWNHFSDEEKQEMLMDYRLAFSAYGEVNWCEALGTVLANDEVINGVSERGGHPVVKKKMRQWYLRITDYAERLLEGLETVEFTDAMKEIQRNWIGKSEGAEMEFSLNPNPSPKGAGGKTPIQTGKSSLTPNPSPKGEGGKTPIQTAKSGVWPQLKDLSRENRKEKTFAEDILWQKLRNNQLGSKVRRQHVIDAFIIDFAFLNEKLLIEIDGEYHSDPGQKDYDNSRTAYLQQLGYKLIRFSNDEVEKNIFKVIKIIKEELAAYSPLSPGRGEGGEASKIKVYTTRPDTIFGVDFMVLAPEHELVTEITTQEQKEEVEKYLDYVKSRSERERLAEVKSITGAFTGAYAINPFDERRIPIWISEYVLAGYGTGAIMAVPCGDQRDFDFARHFNIPITNIIGEYFNGNEANPTKEAILINSGFLNGIKMQDAIGIVLERIEKKGIGQRKLNYKMRDAGFSRQRYWGEPFPIVYKNGVAYAVDEKELPVELPHVENYSPGPEGEGPLANIPEWVNVKANPIHEAESLLSPGRGEGGEASWKRETNTMPGYAGSSWYFLRYMDPHNDEVFADKKAMDYWGQVDVYIGGTEHAVGHLLYSRMWTKVLYDLDYIYFDEPYKKLVNQGMIQGISQVAYVRKTDFEEGAHKSMSNTVIIPESPPASVPEPMLQLYSSEIITDENEHLFKHYNIPIEVVEINTVDSSKNKLDIDLGRKLYSQRLDAIYIRPNAYYYKGDWRSWNERNNSWDKVLDQVFYTASVSEKMSKSKFNVINPNDLINRYGADTFRMYEMFLGPVEQSKPWDTKGIEGVHRFLKKLWRLFYDDTAHPTPPERARPELAEGGRGEVLWNEEKPNDAELKILHKTIKKVEEDTERFSYNTAVSALMVCVNELTDLKCHKREILEPLLILLAPYAPHIAEELYHALGNNSTIIDAEYPKLETKYLIESEKEYPISINGKMRTTITISLDASEKEVESIALNNEIVQKWLEGRSPKKIIFVKNKMVNVVV